MAPPYWLSVLQEMKEVSSTRKYVTEVPQHNAPPLPVEVKDLNKQFETQTFEPVRVGLELYKK
jgi:hypothetical protein